MKSKLFDKPTVTLKDVVAHHAAANLHKEAGQPMVGIFWIYKGKCLGLGDDLNDASDYGEFKTYAGNHHRVWSQFQTMGVVPRGVEYEEVPRGRVAYSTKTKKFVILADACILKDKAAMSEIMKFMNLRSANTVTSSDEHYVCPGCTRAPKEDEDDW